MKTLDFYSRIYLESVAGSDSGVVQVTPETIAEHLEAPAKADVHEASQIMKYYYGEKDRCLFYAIFKEDKMMAAMVIDKDLYEQKNIVFLKQVSAFKHHEGWGKRMVDWIMSKPIRLIFFSSDWSQGEKLLEYWRSYKNPKFVEVVGKDGTHWFYRNKTMFNDAARRTVSRFAKL